MPEMQVFEYAVLRLTPRVEREEFINIGVVLFCKSLKYLDVRTLLNIPRINALTSEILDFDEINGYLLAYELICKGLKEGGPIAGLDMAERFRWLTATRSTIIQASGIHPGLCNSPERMLNRIFAEMVL
jgi:hypothetical protein